MLAEYQSLTRGRKEKENGGLYTNLGWQFVTIPHNLNHKFVLTLHAILRISFLISYCLILEFSGPALDVEAMVNTTVSDILEGREFIPGR